MKELEININKKNTVYTIVCCEAYPDYGADVGDDA
jgi:hypothetical protein